QAQPGPDPRATSTMPVTPRTSVGARRWDRPPSPIWPVVPAPQQNSKPSPRIPQFCPAPTNILVRLLKPATWTGLGLLFVVPSPSCPHSLSPQQKMGGLTLPPTSAQA